MTTHVERAFKFRFYPTDAQAVRPGWPCLPVETV
jgi:hypothetical protein